MKSIINQFADDCNDGILRLAYSVFAVCPSTLILIRNTPFRTKMGIFASSGERVGM
jgi:hypothetical protein